MATQHSDDQLREASGQVIYEVSILGGMLHYLLDSNVTVESSTPDKMRHNAFLHSFLLAARELIHFVYSHEPRPTDIVAENFIVGADVWHTKRPNPPKGFDDGTLLSLISKRLAHLTWDRASGTKPSWGLFRIAWEISKALTVFVNTVPEQLIDPALVEDVKLFDTMLRTIIRQNGSIEELDNAPMSMIWNKADLRF